MLKKFVWLVAATVFFVWQISVQSAFAAEMSADIRTVPLNAAGDSYVLNLKQVKEGKRLFNYACAQCHAGGITKTDPNVGLDPETLALATPPRNNVESLVDYLKNPTTFDGESSIAELHPSLASSDIFPQMRNLTNDDLVALAGHILLQPKVRGEQWGGGKSYR